MWNRLYALMKKEFLTVWKDKRSRFVLIAPPIIQLLLFSFAATLDVKNVPIGIVNLDGGAQSFELIERFQGSPFFSKISFLKGHNEITPFIENMEGLMVVCIDAQFSRNLAAKKSVAISLILDGRRSNSAQIVAGYTTAIVEQFNADYAKKIGVVQHTSTIVPRHWFNPNLLYHWFNVPSLSGILTLVISLVITSLSIAREKEIGTFEQLLVSPLSPFEILAGKTIAAITIGLLEATAILVLGTQLLQVPFRGSLLLFYISVFVFILSVIGVGLFISCIAKTQQQAVLGSFVFMSPAVMLSGFSTPIENMPTWLQPVTNFIPLKYYLVLAKGLFLKDLSASLVWQHIWPMAIIGLVTLTSAGWFFRRRLE